MCQTEVTPGLVFYYMLLTHAHCFLSVMRREDSWRSASPQHLSQGMVPGSQQQHHLEHQSQFQQQSQQQPVLSPQYQHQPPSQPGTVQFQDSQQPAQFFQMLQPATHYHPHQIQFNQEQQRMIIQQNDPSFHQQQLQTGYFSSNVEPVPMIAGPPHAVTPSQGAVGFQHHITPAPRGVTRLFTPVPEQMRPLRHPSVIYHSPHPSEQGPSTSYHQHPPPPPIRAQTWIPPDPQQLQQQERQQIQQQLLQFRQDLWAASIPPILPSATTPSPVPYQQPLSSTASHFCPVHHSLQPSPSPGPDRRTPKPIPPTPSAPQLTEEEAEVEQQRIKEFVERFKVERIKFGYSAANVNQQLAIRYGTTFPAGKIDQFEANQLSLQEMMSTKQVLKCWIIDMARASGMTEKNVQELSESMSPSRRDIRKKRTVIDDHTRTMLEKEYSKNSKPTPALQAEIGNRLGVEKDVIKIWFANQRQRMKRAQMSDKDDSWTQHLVPGFNFEPEIPSADIESQIPLLDLEPEQELEDLQ